VPCAWPVGGTKALRFDGVFLFETEERPSSMPSIWPSFWGVGPIDVRCGGGETSTAVGGSYGSMKAGWRG